MNQLRIAIDGNEANVKNRVGSNVYAFELLTALEQLTQNRDEIKVTVLLAEPALSDLPKTRAGWSYLVVTPQPLWTQFALPVHLFLHKEDYDVLFTPGHYAPRLSSVPYVSSVMDLAYLKFPDQFKEKDRAQLRDWTAYSVKHARKVVAISQATKKDVIEHYHRSPQDVVVAYPAMSSALPPAATVREKAFFRKLGLKNPLIVYVGTFQPRKNLIRLIEAYEQVCRRIAASEVRAKTSRSKASIGLPQLVLAGKVGWLSDEVFQRVEDSVFRNKIILPGFVTEAQKYALLKAADCSVLVGLYEGFGIPPLESLSVGTIPIVSQTSSLPEVVGKAGILVDPENVADIADGLYRALTVTAKDKAKFRVLARAQVKRFSWEQSAEVVLQTLEEVCRT